MIKSGEHNAEIGDRFHNHQHGISVIPKVDQSHGEVASETDSHIHPHELERILLPLLRVGEQQACDDDSENHKGGIADQTDGQVEMVVDPVVLGQQQCNSA